MTDAGAETLKVFHHARAGRVCVYRPIPPSGRVTWCTRSDLNGHWMPCANPHPAADVIDVPIDPPAEAMAAAASRIDLEVEAERQRLTTAECPDPWQVPMLGNWLGGLRTAAAVLRLEEPADECTLHCGCRGRWPEHRRRCPRCGEESHHSVDDCPRQP